MNKIYLQFIKRKVIYRLKKKIKNISFTKNTPKDTNTLLVSNMIQRAELGETMLYPFYWYESILKKKLGLSFCEIITTDLVNESNNLSKNIIEQPQITRIFFQPEFEMDSTKLINSLQYLKNVYPNAKIAYMDWYAPLHIRNSIIVDPYIDLYIKKQTYADFSEYSKPTIGDTNLSDYYAKRHNLDLPTTEFTPPKDFDKKMVSWSNFALSPLMIDLFMGELNTGESKTIDLHSRIVVNGVPWYKAMRQEAKDAVSKLPKNEFKIAAEGLVSRADYYKEMNNSKMCFSPFGYGEICWRDFEAIATGTLLIKPNMDHLTSFGDVFEPNETYVPLSWDLSDFKDKIEYYAKNPKERKRITTNAFNQIQSSIKNNDFVELIERFY